MNVEDSDIEEVNDTEFKEALGPSYIMVQFPPDGVPPMYRSWLDTANNCIGGSFAGVPPNYVVDGAAENVEPLRLLDPTLTTLNLLVVNTRSNADFVAGMLGGNNLHTWVIASQEPAHFR